MNIYSQIISDVYSEPEASDIVASYCLPELEGIKEQARSNNALLGLGL